MTTTVGGRRGRMVAALMAAMAASAAVAVVLPAGPAGAATITVTTTDDELNADGDCSLREAVEAANTDTAVDACPAGSGTDTIVLPAGTFELASQLVVSDPDGLTIAGAGSSSTGIIGSGGHRLIDVTAGTFTVDSLTLAGGEAGAEPGGAIRSVDDGVWVLDAVLAENQGGHGGAIESVGGYVNAERSAFIGNVAASDELNGNGGAIRTGTGFVNVDETTFVGNMAANVGGAILTSSGRVSSIRSMFTENEARAGGAIYNSFGLITILNSTLHANTTTDINGNLGGTVQTSTLGGGITLQFVTLTDTLVGLGVLGALDTGAFIITGSIITGNAGGQCSFFGEPVTSAGGNLVGDNSCGVGQPTDAVVADPLLGPLADNGGATFTRLPQAASPAIDVLGAGPPCPETDQRRVDRPQDGDGDGAAGCDSGAVEVAAAADPIPETPGEPATPTPTPAPSAQPVAAQPTFTG